MRSRTRRRRRRRQRRAKASRRRSRRKAVLTMMMIRMSRYFLVQRPRKHMPLASNRSPFIRPYASTSSLKAESEFWRNLIRCPRMTTQAEISRMTFSGQLIRVPSIDDDDDDGKEYLATDKTMKQFNYRLCAQAARSG